MSTENESKVASYVHEHDAKSAKEFLDLLSPNNDDWMLGHKLDYVFRGASHMGYKLEPKALREDQRPLLCRALDSVGFSEERTLPLVRSCGVDPPWDRRYVDVIRQRQAEHTALRDFADLADEIGIFTPNAAPFDRSDFAESLVRTPPKARYQPCELAAMAQHHGVPTRLLDWTTNPLAAVFFAADGPAPDDATHLGVYALLRSGPHIDASDGTGLQVFAPRRNQNKYMVAQRGLFTWIGDQDAKYVDTGHWQTTEDAIAERWNAMGIAAQAQYLNVNPPPLRRITLSREHLPDLYVRLWRHDMSRAHMMPTLDNVAKSLEQLWTAADDPNSAMVTKVLHYRQQVRDQQEQAAAERAFAEGRPIAKRPKLPKK